MAYTLSNLIRDALDEMGQVVTTVATGGSTTTAQDSNANGAYGDDADALQNGTLFVVRDAGGAAAAPEGEMQRISDYDGTIITVGTAFSAAIASGDVIAIGSSQFPLQTCIQFANRTLQSFGTISLVDIATLTPSAGVSEYTWPVAWKFAEPYRIDIQQSTVSGDNQWLELQRGRYEVEPATAGSTGKIIFRGGYYPPTSYAVRVHYSGLHPKLNTYSDPVHESIHPRLAQIALVEQLTGWFVRQQNGKDNWWREALNLAQNNLVLAKQQYKIWKPARNARLMGI